MLSITGNEDERQRAADMVGDLIQHHAKDVSQIEKRHKESARSQDN